MNLKKQLFFAMAAALSLQMATAQTGVPEGMEITAQEWCKSVKAGWNLGNTFESCGANWDNSTWTWDDNSNYSTRQNWETSWGNPAPDEAMIKAVADAGFNAIRIPVRWEPHVTDYSTMAIDPVWMKKVKDVVDLCYKYDMYVVINTHHEMWLESNPVEKHQERVNAMLSKLWTNIATAFADYDGRLAFAGVNEVHLKDYWGDPTSENTAALNSFLQTFVDAVRDTGGNNMYRNLVVQTYVCNPNFGITIPTDPVSDRMSVEFHYYQPWDYCGLGAYYYWDDVNTLRQDMDKAVRNWWNKGYGVMVGEFGCTMHYDENASAEEQEKQKQNTGYYCEVITKLMRERGFAGFVWDNNSFINPKNPPQEQYGVFDRDDNMSHRNSYVINSIMEGAKQEYVGGELPGTNVPDLDPYTAPGTVIWTGKEELNWGDGLQLTLGASNFTDLVSGAKLELYYTTIGGGAKAQMFDGWWTNPNMVSFDDGKGHTGWDFDLSGSTHCLSLTISDATLEILKEKGLVIQGYAAMLQRVVVVNPSGEQPGTDPDPDQPGTDPDPEQPGTEPTTTSADWYHNAVEYYANSGKSIWTGDHALNWDKAVLKIEDNKFSNLSDNSLLVICYEPSQSADYYQMLLSNSWWDGNVVFVHGSESGKSFVIDANDSYFAVTLPSETISKLNLQGLDIQGYGLTVKEVLVLDATSISKIITGDANADHKVDIADVVSVITYLQKAKAGKDVDWIINRKSADVNTTAGVDNDDVKGIADIILAQ